MIVDTRVEFASNTALNTGTPGTYLIGNQVDLGAAGEDQAGGGDNPMYLVIAVKESVTSGGAATVQFKLASDDTASIATDGTASEHIVTPAIPKAQLTAGKTFAFALPSGRGVAYERYLGLLQVTGTAALTAGRINAFLTRDVGSYKAYPDAI